MHPKPDPLQEQRTHAAGNGNAASGHRGAALRSGLSYRRFDFQARHNGAEAPSHLAPPFVTSGDAIASLVGLIEQALPGAVVTIDWQPPASRAPTRFEAAGPGTAPALDAPGEPLEAHVVLCDEREQPLGWLHVRSPWPGPIDSATRHMIHALARLLSGHLSDQRRMAELLRLASVDPLTELLNRRAFVAQLNDTWQHTHARGSRAWLLLVDVDGLKRANDEHGHAVGDLLLRDVAGSLRSAGSRRDTSARLRGDEFATLLMDCGTRADVDRFVGGFDRRLARAQKARPGRVTASVGACAMTNAASPTAALEKADRELYLVKRERGALRES